MQSAKVLIGGLGTGALLMYFLDPDRGRRRRSLVRDKAVHARKSAEDAVGKAARDLRNRAKGLGAAMRSRFSGNESDDVVLTERVRSELGHVVSHPGAIQVHVDSGDVTLSGDVPPEEVSDLIARVRRVRGVKHVENDLDVHDLPEVTAH